MGEESAVAHIAAIADKQGRVMVMMTHNTDIGDSWEREGDDPQFFIHFSPNGYAVGLNAALYSMTH
jgi:phosphoribosylformylglycinamidine (FGAM) synthase-like amidotransferase family enzyme